MKIGPAIDVSPAAAGLLSIGLILSFIPSDAARDLGMLLLLSGSYLAIRNPSLVRRAVLSVVAAVILSVPSAIIHSDGPAAVRSSEPTLGTATPVAAAPPVAPVATDSDPSIPGLHAVDVTKNLAARGYQCSDMRREASGVSWSCDFRSENIVTVSGQGPTRIEYVSVTSLGDETEAAAALGYIATIPFDGADPSTAREWVKQNIRQGGRRIIGPVEYRLSVDGGSARTLSIASPASRYFR